VTQWGAVVHGNPAYAILLALTVVVAAWALWHSLTRRERRSGWRLVLRVIMLVLAVVWVGLMAWLRPFTAQQTALAAMESDGNVIVSESATQIVMTPTSDASPLGVFFQPGAKVEARAYAAVLRPLAESGYTVADLPAASAFTQIEGAVHAQFGDYGPQPGDGVPTISDDDARKQTSDAALTYLELLVPGLPQR
jgi:uncharacterized membrane protein (DUF485 family)